MTPYFLQSWYKHCTPKFASLLIIRSQIIPLITCLSPGFTSLLFYHQHLSPLVLSKSYLLWVYFLIAVKAEFLCFKYVVLQISSSCMIGRKSLNHFSINILLGKCRDPVHYEEITVQAKGGYGFTACRLFPMQQTLLVPSEWRSFHLPKFSACWFLQSHRKFF